jgi:hypothetical protein
VREAWALAQSLRLPFLLIPFAGLTTFPLCAQLENVNFSLQSSNRTCSSSTSGNPACWTTATTGVTITYTLGSGEPGLQFCISTGEATCNGVWSAPPITTYRRREMLWKVIDC